MSTRPLLGRHHHRHWDDSAMSTSTTSSSSTLPTSSSSFLSSSISRQKQKMKQRRLEKQQRPLQKQQKHHQQQQQQRSVHHPNDHRLSSWVASSPTAATVGTVVSPSPSSFHLPKSSSTSSPTSVMIDMFPIAEEEGDEGEVEGPGKGKKEDKAADRSSYINNINNKGSSNVDVVDFDCNVVINDDDIDNYIFHDDDDLDDDNDSSSSSSSNKTSDSSNVMSGLLAGWNTTTTTTTTTTNHSVFSTSRDENGDDGRVLSEEFKAALDRIKNNDRIDNNNAPTINTPPGSDFTTSTGGVLFGNVLSSYNHSPAASSSSLAVATADGGMSDVEVARFFDSTPAAAAASASASARSGGNYSLWDNSTAYGTTTEESASSVAPSDENNVVNNIRLRAQKFSSSFSSEQNGRSQFAQNLLDDSMMKNRTNIGNGIGVSQTQQGRDEMTRAALSRAAHILGRQQQQQRQNIQQIQSRSIPYSGRSNNGSLEREDDEATRFVLGQMNKLQSHTHASTAKYRRAIRSVSDELRESSAVVDALHAQLQKAMAVRDEKQTQLEHKKMLREHEIETSEVQTLHLQIVLELLDIADPTDNGSKNKVQQKQKRQADLMRVAGLTTSVVGGAKIELTSSSDVCSAMDKYKDVTVDELRVRKQHLQGIWKLIELSKTKELDVEFDSWAQSKAMKEDAVKKYLLLNKYNQI